MAQRFCTKCGASNLDTAQFCGGCGGPMAAAAPPPPPAAPAYVPPPSPPQPVYAPPPAAAYPPPPTPGYPPAPAYAPPPGAGYPAPASKAPMIVVALLVLGGGGFAAWWFFFRGGPGKTPEATFEAAKKCIINDDFAAIYDLLAPPARKQLDDQLAMMKKAVADNPAIKNDPNCPPNVETMDIRAFLTWASSKMPAAEKAKMKAEVQSSTIEKVDINGDTATVRLKTPNGTDSMMMTRIDGKWYLSQMPN